MKLTRGTTTYEITAANVDRCEGIVCRYTVKATRTGETPALYSRDSHWHDMKRSEARDLLRDTYFFDRFLADEVLDIASAEADIASKVAFLQNCVIGLGQGPVPAAPCIAPTSPNGLWDCSCSECLSLQRAADDWACDECGQSVTSDGHVSDQHLTWCSLHTGNVVSS
jgi:hypothetical protein